MSSTREQVRQRRYATLGGVICGVIVYCVFRPVVHATMGSQLGDNSVVFHTAHWPGWIRHGFWPLDLIVMCAGWCAGLYTVLRGMPDINQMSLGRFIGTACLRIFTGGGALGGVVGVAFGGWYMGLELAVIFGVVALAGFAAAALVAMAIIATMFGIYWGGRKLWRDRLEHSRFSRQLRRVGRYLNADDVADDTGNDSAAPADETV